MDKIQQQILAFVRGLSPRQGILLAGGVAVVGLTVWFFVRLMGGDYKPLYTGLASADAQNLVQKLGAANIDSQISSDGTTVLVPSDQLDKARVAVASQGPLASGRMGFELFDKPNWSGSDFSEKVNYQRALEAELERTIQTMSGVDAVRVHLVLPQESLFTDRERPAKAAVVLKMRGTRLTDQVASSIANLVSSAWDDLSPQNVTVVTTDGQTPGQTHGHAIGSPDGMADLETAMAEKVVQVLSPIVGANHVKSSVSIEYDPTSGESTQELYDPNTTAVLTSQISQESSNDLSPSGIPGTPSNVPNAPAFGAAANQTKTTEVTQGIRSESKSYAVSRTTKHLIEPPGRIKRVAAAILVDDYIERKEERGKVTETSRKRTPEEMKQIEELARAALGLDASRGDQISVQNIAFQQTPAEKPVPPTATEHILRIAEHWTGVLRYAALLLLFAMVYLLLLRPVMKQILAILKAPALRLSHARASAAATAALPTQNAIEESLFEEELAGASTEVKRAVALKKQIVSKVQTDPGSASRLIQNWIREAEVKK